MLTDLKSKKKYCRNTFPPSKTDPPLREGVMRTNIDFQNFWCQCTQLCSLSRNRQKLLSEHSHQPKLTHALNGARNTYTDFQNSGVNLIRYAQRSQIGRKFLPEHIPTPQSWSWFREGAIGANIDFHKSGVIWLLFSLIPIRPKFLFGTNSYPPKLTHPSEKELSIPQM